MAKPSGRSTEFRARLKLIKKKYLIKAETRRLKGSPRHPGTNDSYPRS